MIATVVCAWNSGRPSFWYDEAATVSAINRSVPDMTALLSRIDVVHGGYYMLMHGWWRLTGHWGGFGGSEFAMRLPSAVAVGIAAALVVCIGRTLVALRFGVLAGALLVCLPRVLWAGSEARPYAGSMALAAAATWLVLLAVRRGGWWWVSYAVLATACTVWFLPSGTLVAAHLLYVLLTTRRRNRLYGMLIAAVMVAAAVLPFAMFAHRQVAQIAWLSPFSTQTVVAYLQFEYVDGAPVAGVLILLLLLGIAVIALLGTVGRIDRRALTLGLAWVAVPAVVILGYSWLGSPTYVPRYLSFTAPGMALVIAVAVRVIARQFTRPGAVRAIWLPAVAVLALGVAAVPAFVAQRSVYGKVGGTDFSQVADFVGRHARPGDCVAFERTASWSPVSERVVKQAKPRDFRNVRDIGPSTPAARAHVLWDLDRPETDYAAWARTCSVMWVVTDGERATGSVFRPGGSPPWYFKPFHFENTVLYRELAGDGLTIVGRIGFHRSQVVRMTR
ncbi:glycosyltransferase family 39 protein [Williamsia sterculiae]|uniref:glycosyltransferase family 39 protein n=1 Tax=Williamsia sterculiae TaxID=1344003 RepID=UPI0011814FC8|nr:glycosyltransferase family 39 protein [Williamsia sterculiae]